MCGIIGYIGQRNAPSIIFQGLKKLEYRGYDSAGIAVHHNREVFLIKSPGKLAALESKLKELPEEASIGMGHTRWATHGAPTISNAHPHRAPGVTIVHNGIIENYKELRQHLLAQGMTFQSETDTEVVVQLISSAFHTLGDESQALQKTMSQLKGSFAFGVMFDSLPNEIFLVKNGSPLVLGLGDGENFFGSDVIPFCQHARRVIYLEDGEWGRMSHDQVQIWDSDGHLLDKKGEPLLYNVGSVEKHGYRHFMRKEIYEQPNVIANNIENLTHRPEPTLNTQALGIDQLDLNKVEKIQIIGCGTAYIAGLLGKYFLEPATEIPVNVELASEFRYRDPHFGEPSKNLIIAISQSGETADTLASVKHARDQGCQILSICNAMHSSIPRSSHSMLYMDAGPEIGVASTKAFTSQVLCIYLFSLALSQYRGRLDQETSASIFKDLQKLPAYLTSVLESETQIKELAKRYYEYPNFLFIGRGPSYPIALEGALKLKEISYIHAEGYAAGELKHGPIALIDRHMPVVAIAPTDPYLDKVISNIEEIRAREGRVIIVGDQNHPHLAEMSDEIIHCPTIHHGAFQSILSTIPVQLLAYHIAICRGTDIDQPRNLAKSVTVE